MKEYSDRISLTRNSRGIYSLDTTKGCASGMANEEGGCYNDCYAAKSAKIYGYDFSKTVLRHFDNEEHRSQIVKQINRSKLDFIRIGCSGDPSEHWEHTMSVIRAIEKCNKQIVIITRHWTPMDIDHLRYLSTINVCINTSVSALDKPEIRESCLREYHRIKPYCKSILRVVSCDFNTENTEGKRMDKIQRRLFEYEDTLDTVLRVGSNNALVRDGIINVKRTKFLDGFTLASKANKNTYFGKCSTCHEMCGINIKPKNRIYSEKRGIIKQLLLFKNKTAAHK